MTPTLPVPEADQQQRDLRAAQEYNSSLLGLISGLNTRLNHIEASCWWRLRTAYRHWRTRLRRLLPAAGFFGPLWRLLLPFTARGRGLLRAGLARLLGKLYLLVEREPVSIVPRDQAGLMTYSPGDHVGYGRWRLLNMPRPIDLRDYAARVGDLSYQPTISVLVPVYNTRPEFLEAALRSVVAQVYPHWELCIADDASTDPAIRGLLARFAAADRRVKVRYRHANGHISAATNSALELATGDFCAFVDHDDLLTPDALFQNVVALNRQPDLDLLYSDEDHIDEKDGPHNPQFKPDWSPDRLLACNYISHLAVIRTALLRELGGLRVGFEGAQDHDLLLRLSERTQRIHHIPRVLYHWRSHAGSTACSISAKGYSRHAASAAVREALARRGQRGTVQPCHPTAPYFLVRYDIVRPGRVSILVPTRNQAKVLDTCLTSIFASTDYADFEVLAVDNGSDEPKVQRLLARYRRQERQRFRVLSRPGPFNFSRLINAGAAEASGDYLVLLNNDTEIIHRDWLSALVEQAQRPQMGCVGAQLLFPDYTIQHAGVVVGQAGVAEHVGRGYLPHDPGTFDLLEIIHNYSAVTAACLMVRREVFEQAGGFDEAFAVEFNDVDFCLRVREAGYHNVYLPHVRLYHHESLTRGHPLASAESARRHEREIELFKSRWPAYLSGDPSWSRHLNLPRNRTRIVA